MTHILGILGHPLDHSVSVPMHMSAIFSLGIDYVYMSFDVPPENIPHAMEQFKKENIKGFNVTIPYKEIIMNYLDKIDAKARRIGAVNTVNKENGLLKGYNTDGIGYIRSLQEQTGFNPSGKGVLLIGAGGAAKAVAFALLESGIKIIVVANRTIDRTDKLIKHLKRYFPNAAFRNIGLEKINRIARKDINLIVNTTSVGMKNAGGIDIDLTGFGKNTIVSDIVYNPVKTQFLMRAEQAGMITHNGIGMLVHQGAESFKIWTGVQPPVDAMRQAAIRALADANGK